MMHVFTFHLKLNRGCNQGVISDIKAWKEFSHITVVGHDAVTVTVERLQHFCNALSPFHAAASIFRRRFNCLAISRALHN